MARQANQRIQDLASKISADTAPHDIDETAVKTASANGNINDGDADEFMQFLKELGDDGSNTVDADDDADDLSTD